jgi:hypothetical protein
VLKEKDNKIIIIIIIIIVKGPDDFILGKALFDADQFPGGCGGTALSCWTHLMLNRIEDRKLGPA